MHLIKGYLYIYMNYFTSRCMPECTEANSIEYIHHAAFPGTIKPNTNKISFFFSSRKRHTRSYGDWSSDVCSSDLSGDERRRPHARVTVLLEIGHELLADRAAGHRKAH